jgi:hypothetical protein
MSFMRGDRPENLCGNLHELQILWRERRKINCCKYVCRTAYDLYFTSKVSPCSTSSAPIINQSVYSSLLADPKARKVIIVEHPLLPLYIKEIMARTLFENQVCGCVGIFLYDIYTLTTLLGSFSFFCFESSIILICGGTDYWPCHRLWTSRVGCPSCKFIISYTMLFLPIFNHSD